MTPLLLRPLNGKEREALESGLSYASRIAGRGSEHDLQMPDVQALYDAFLAEGIDDNDAIIALGLAFGRRLIEHGQLEWVRAVDEYGEETSVAVPGLLLCAHPVSMIQKRLSEGEPVDLEDLCAGVLEALAKQRDEADAR